MESGWLKGMLHRHLFHQLQKIEIRRIRTGIHASRVAGGLSDFSGFDAHRPSLQDITHFAANRNESGLGAVRLQQPEAIGAHDERQHVVQPLD